MLDQVENNGHLFERSTERCRYCGMGVLRFFFTEGDVPDCKGGAK